MEEPAAPRLHRGAHLEAAAREDLDAYGVAELQARTGAALRRKTSGRQAADALFSFGKG
jgi:uncharacterized small protein (DUF1192 family)